MNNENMIGKRFGEWTVIGAGEPHILPDGNKKKTLKCRCDCGTIRDVAMQRLKNGMSTCCGDCKKPNLIGKQFGNLTVVGVGDYHIRNDGNKVKKWECVCKCGEIRYHSTQVLLSGKVKSCGCMHDYYAKVNNTVHGDSHTRLHNTWSKMISRCYSKSDYHYKWYGDRGIKMCDEWKDNYLSFKEWALANGYDENLTIDRIDNDGDYCPENCRWVTMKVQSNNTRRNKFYEAFGEKHTLSEWADIKGVSKELLSGRVKNGWDIERALTEKKRETVNGHYVYDR